MSFDALLDELHNLENRRVMNKSVDFWEPPPRPRADHRRALKATLGKLEHLTKSLTPTSTPAEKAAIEREQLIKRCRTEIPVVLQKSMARFEAGEITGDQLRLTQARVIRLTDTLSNYGIQL